MIKQDSKHAGTNFWFGFALGSITLTAAAYMLGTKKGREKLKQLLDYAESVQDVPEELFALLPSIKEMLTKQSGSTSPQGHVATENEHKSSFTDHIGQSLESIIEKVKSSSEEKNDPSANKSSTKKYFIKSETS